jgi:hypothetical protein
MEQKCKFNANYQRAEIFTVKILILVDVLLEISTSFYKDKTSPQGAFLSLIQDHFWS